MRKDKFFLLFSVLFLSCQSSDPLIEENPKGFSEEPKKTVVKNQLTPLKRKNSALFQWSLLVAGPHVSKEVLKEAPLRFKRIQDLLENRLSSGDVTHLVKLLNDAVYQDCDITYGPLTREENSYLSLFLPYVLMGKKASKISLVFLAGTLLDSFGKKVEYAKNPDGEPFLIITDQGKEFYLTTGERFVLTNPGALKKGYPSLKASGASRYFRPLSSGQIEALFYYHLSRAALWGANYSLARTSLQKAYSLDSKSPEILKVYGGVLVQEKSSADEGYGLLQKALKERKWDPELWEILGDFHFSQHSFADARECYLKVQAIKDSPRLKLSVSKVYFQLGQYKKSLQILTKLLSSNLSKELKLTTTVIRGAVFLEKGDEKEGLADLQGAIKLNPDLPAIYGTLAEYYFRKKRYLMSRKYFQKYLEYEKDPHLRERAVQKLLLIKKFLEKGKNIDKKDLAKTMKDRDPEIRADALRTIQSSQDKSLSEKIEFFKKYLDDKSPQVKVLAIRFLIGTSESHLPQVEKFLQHKDPRVKAEVIFCMKKCRESRYLPKILPFLQDESPYVRDAALQALQEICSEIETFGFDPMKSPKEQKKAIEKWKQVVKENQ